MADMFLGPVITKVVDLLAEEVKSLKGVRKEVESLQKELDFSYSFLKYAEGKPEKGDTNDLMLTWVKQVMDEANRTVEIIDKYRYLVEAEKHNSQSFFRKVVWFFKDFKQRRHIASEIQEVNDSLGKIKNRVERCGLRLPLEQGASSTTTNVEAPDPRLKSRFIQKDELVGIETKSKEIIQKLLEESPTRSVISLVGQGGIGKTTLATSVYNDAVVQEKFESRAWITVSRPFNLKKILKSMRRQVCKSEPGMEEVEDAEQIQYLHESLEAKRYLFVFDDVWEEEFWGFVESVLLENNKGSRIVITTRKNEVAKSSLCDLVPLQTWSPAKALELFRKKVGQCPKELEDLSRAIVSRCRGLPLVIATVARLLSTKEKVELEWRRVLEDLNSKSEMDSQLLEILSLSYYDLPSPLKSCFLYFGIFPEDSSILDERLYALWIAEGFIEARGNRTLEEVAEAYLNELIQRNLVTFKLVVGEGKVCGVHDLMHEVILSRADKVCLCRTWDENESRFRGAGRRLRISGSNENVLKHVGASTLRSVFFWDIDDKFIETESSVVTLFKRFKLLEVMDFQRVPLNTLPKEVGNLFLLKYLSLKETNVKVLPKSIRNLQKLQTLDIRDTLIRELPAEINELRNLRHLLAYKYNYSNTSSFDFVEGVRMHEGFGNLEDLQTLTSFEAHPGGVGLVKELELLRKLRWLDVSTITSETWRGVCASIGNMDHLQRLSLGAKDENEVLDLQHISSPPHFLRELVVVGRLQNFHDMIPVFRNLRGLGLEFSWLIDDPCKCLKELPNLEILSLSQKAYVGEELHFEKGGFEKLKELRLIRLYGLKHIEIDGGALPALEKLVLYACPLLEELPSVNHLTKLKHFVVDGRRVSNWRRSPVYSLLIEWQEDGKGVSIRV